MKSLVGSVPRTTLLIIWLMASSIAPAQQGPTAEEMHAEMFSMAGPRLELRDNGLVYKKRAKEPYSGVIMNGEGSEFRYVDGVLEVHSGMLRSGHPESKNIMLDGTRVTRRIIYGDNDQPKSDEIIFEGKHLSDLAEPGEFDPSSVSMPDIDTLRIDKSGPVSEYWYDNGNRASTVRYVDGKCCLATSWHENGQKRHEQNYADGTVIRIWDENGVTVHLEDIEASRLSAVARNGIREYYFARDELPADIPTINFVGGDPQLKGDYVDAVTVADGVISISFGSNAGDDFSGRTLALTPTFEGRSVSWKCSSPDIDTALLPETCL